MKFEEKNILIEKGKIEQEYNLLFKRLYPGLMFYTNRFLDEDEAEDVVQDAFVELWEKRNEIDLGDSIHTFMYRSVYFKAINIIRHKNVENNYSQSLIDIYQKKIDYFHPDENDTIRKMESNEINKEIFSVIESLPEKCKEVFKLSYLNDMKNKEIAELLNISLRTVEAHMYKALKFLRANLSHLMPVILWIQVFFMKYK